MSSGGRSRRPVALSCQIPSQSGYPYKCFVQGGYGLVFAALNVDRDQEQENAVVKINTEFDVNEWNCETGERIPVAAESWDGWKIFTTDFQPGGQKLFVAGAEAAPVTQPAETYDRSTASAIDGPFEYRLSEPKVCVLDYARYRVNDGSWNEAEDVLKIDRYIREERGVMRRGGKMLQPWFVAQHSVKDLCSVELTFNFKIEAMPEWVDLVLEEPEHFDVLVNGLPLETAVVQKPFGEDGWIDAAFLRVRIPADLLNEGRNEISLKTRYNENSNLENIYLLAEFVWNSMELNER